MSGAIDTSAVDTILGQIIALVPVSVTIGSVTVTGSRTDQSERYRLTADGREHPYAFSVIIRVSDLTAAGVSVPAPLSRVTVDGTEYRVLTVHRLALGVAVRLDLGDYYGD